MTDMKKILFGLDSTLVKTIQSNLDTEWIDATFHNLDDPELNLAKFDCVVPLTYPEYERLRAEAEAGARNFIVPKAGPMKEADNKARFNKFLLANGFANFLPILYGQYVRYPFIFKRKLDNDGEHSRIIASRQEQIEFERDTDCSDYFRQEYVGGRREYTTHMLVINGTPKFSLTYEFEFDRDCFVKGKWFAPADRREVTMPFLAELAEITRKLGYDGTCCFNYKISNGVPKIFEMNPRFGATLCNSVNEYLRAYLDVVSGADKGDHAA